MPPLSRIRTDTAVTDKTESSQDSASSSISARLYDLKEADSTSILVYEWQGGISTMSQQELCHELDNNIKRKRSRVTRKPIERFTSTIEVKRHDLFLGDEKDSYKDYPNYDSSLASIRVPRNIFWSRAFFGNYDELYIISPEASPTNSVAGSEESRRVTPASTWSPPDVHAGAETTD